MASSLASSQYIRIIPDTPYDSRRTYSKGLYIFNQSQVQAYILISPGGYWSIHQKAFVILITTLTFIKDKADVRIKEKS